MSLRRTSSSFGSGPSTTMAPKKGALLDHAEPFEVDETSWEGWQDPTLEVESYDWIDDRLMDETVQELRTEIAEKLALGQVPLTVENNMRTMEDVRKHFPYVAFDKATDKVKDLEERLRVSEAEKLQLRLDLQAKEKELADLEAKLQEKAPSMPVAAREKFANLEARLSALFLGRKTLDGPQVKTKAWTDEIEKACNGRLPSDDDVEARQSWLVTKFAGLLERFVKDRTTIRRQYKQLSDSRKELDKLGLRAPTVEHKLDVAINPLLAG